MADGSANHPDFTVSKWSLGEVRNLMAYWLTTSSEFTPLALGRTTLVVECDGTQHEEPRAKSYDLARMREWDKQRNVMTIRHSSEEIRSDYLGCAEKTFDKLDRISQSTAEVSSE